ncbi:MAG: hypothetical protein ACKV2U_33020 [Bryobacteraceae bacterium]
MIPPSASWHLGLDLGQRRDFSALATLTCEWTVEGRDPVSWNWIRVPKLILRDIERFPLGTSYALYTQVLDERLTHIGGLVPAYATQQVTLVVDAGGPGAPVVDELRRARLDLTLKPLIITGGHEPGVTPGGCLTVPRKVLLTNLILLLDHGKLVTSKDLEYWPILLEEMLDLNAATSQPNKTSNHDDMVVSLALAAWQATRQHPELLPMRMTAKARWSPTGSLF